jgi:hypothetical protein
LQDDALQTLFERSPGVVCAACTSADVALLLSLGIPATLASGLAQLGGRHLDKVCQTYRLGKFAPQPGVEYLNDWRTSHVVLLGWSLATLTRDEPRGLAEIVAHFGDIERYLEICLERFCLWVPSQEEFDKFLYRLKYANAKEAGAAIKDCLKSCKRKLVPRWTLEDVPKDLAAALRWLGTPVSSDGKRCSGGEAWSCFEQMFDNKCIAPWLEELEGTEDAVERNLLMLGATTGGMAHMQAVRMFTKLRAHLKNNGTRGECLVPKEEFQQYIRSVELMLKTMNALLKQRRNSA